ncbi:MAG: hypothetical protein ACRC2U_16920, partial [Aeromonas sp.]
MSDQAKKAHNRRSAGWMGLHRGHQARPLEWVIEKGIFIISLSAIITTLLIFLFIARESWPILTGQMDNSAKTQLIQPTDAAQYSDTELAAYLELPLKDYQAMDSATRQLMLEVKAEATKEKPTDPDAMLNTTSWRYLLESHQWQGYDRPSYIWQPISEVEKFNLVPLIIG